MTAPGRILASIPRPPRLPRPRLSRGETWVFRMGFIAGFLAVAVLFIPWR